MADQYDVIVIGAGPGGYICAIRAAQLGLKAAIVDKEWLGGVCLNVGCIPSKALLHNAAVAEMLHRGKDFGFSVDNIRLDYGAAVKRSRQVSERLVKGVGLLMRKNKIDVHMGMAVLKSANEVQVTGKDGEQTLSTRNVVVATGARVAVPPSFTVDGEKVVTYREAILQTHRPESAVIIGAGAIGVEFATIWNAYGCKVTLVEMLPTLIPREDEEVAKELAKQFSKAGIGIKTGTRVERIELGGPGVQVTVSAGEGGKEEMLEAEQALVAIGFKPNSGELGLEALGVEMERGFIKIDDYMRTNVEGIWSIGDVTGKTGWAHTASAQGVVAAEAMAGHETFPLDYTYMPSAVYCHPQVAAFGLTEKAAREQGYDVKVGKFPFIANGKALGMGDYQGFVKILSDAKYGEILGAHLIGPEVTELLPELTLAHNMELTAEEISRNVHAHPSLSETLMEAAHGLAGGYLNI